MLSLPLLSVRTIEIHLKISLTFNKSKPWLKTICLDHKVVDFILGILNEEGSWPWILKRSNIGQIAGKMISKKIGGLFSLCLWRVVQKPSRAPLQSPSQWGSTGCIQCSIAEELCALSFHSSQVETLEIGGVVCCPQGPLLVEGPLFILSLFAVTQAACTGLENWGLSI